MVFSLLYLFDINCFSSDFHNCSDAPNITGVYNTSHHDWGLFPVYCDQTYDGGGISYSV